jgi:hypothetical protein
VYCMKRKKHAYHHPAKAPQSSLRLVVIFSAIVLLLISISLAIKVFHMIQASVFDGKNRFTFAIQDIKRTRIYSFDPKEKTISQFILQEQLPLSEVGKRTGILLDSTIQSQHDFESRDKASTLLFYMLTHPTQTKTELNMYDLIRLFLFANGIDELDTTEKAIAGVSDTTHSDQSLAELLADATLITEKKSIAVVNGTGESGFGKRLERVLSNSGATVISVTTARVPDEKSRIVAPEDSYTLQKLAAYLQYPVIIAETGTISDILIVIGRDKAESSVF